jgi:hypothetical protein
MIHWFMAKVFRSWDVDRAGFFAAFLTGAFPVLGLGFAGESFDFAAVAKDRRKVKNDCSDDRALPVLEEVSARRKCQML